MDRVLRSLPLNKAPGMDNISNTMIKSVWELIKEHIFKRRLAYQKKDPLRLLTHMYTGQNWLKDNLSKRDATTDPQTHSVQNAGKTGKQPTTSANAQHMQR
jgi:hypothetical protein